MTSELLFSGRTFAGARFAERSTGMSLILDYLVSIPAVTWLKYCRYDVKHYPINQGMHRIYSCNFDTVLSALKQLIVRVPMTSRYQVTSLTLIINIFIVGKHCKVSPPPPNNNSCRNSLAGCTSCWVHQCSKILGYHKNWGCHFMY